MYFTEWTLVGIALEACMYSVIISAVLRGWNAVFYIVHAVVGILSNVTTLTDFDALFSFFSFSWHHLFKYF
jgi:hypothetical protein